MKQSIPREVFEAKIRNGGSLDCQEIRRESKHNKCRQNRTRLVLSLMSKSKGNKRQSSFAENN